LLNACRQGSEGALGLAPLVESELRRVAQAYLSKESPGHTLHLTALINEAYVRLIEWKTVSWQNRADFYAVAAKMMRRVLVNHARGERRRVGRRCDHVGMSEQCDATRRLGERTHGAHAIVRTALIGQHRL